MRFARAPALLALAVLATACATASADLLESGLAISVLPANCGYVLQVRAGDTCQSLATFGGMSLAKFQALNPLTLCGVLPPAPGSLMCVGDQLSFCSNYYRTVKGDTCGKIQDSVGPVLAVASGVSCDASLPVNTPVCVQPTPNACDVDTLCNVKLSDGMRALLDIVPDWCTVLSECKASFTATTIDGVPAFMATVNDVTPAVSAVSDNDGHPELLNFVAKRTAGPAQLQMAFVPNAHGDGEHAVTFATNLGSTKRKLLAYTGSTGFYHPRRY